MELVAKGTVLNNRYEIGDLVGSGGMADVYRGTDLNSGETVAIKILKPQFSDDPQQIMRFKREAEWAYRV